MPAPVVFRLELAMYCTYPGTLQSLKPHLVCMLVQETGDRLVEDCAQIYLVATNKM